MVKSNSLLLKAKQLTTSKKTNLKHDTIIEKKNLDKKVLKSSTENENSEKKMKNPYYDEVMHLKSKYKNVWDTLFLGGVEDFTANGSRAKLWDELEDDCLSLTEKFSSVAPDERALKIIKHFGPVIDFGAGRGYW